MMTLEEMKRRKAEMGLSCEEIAERSGVPLGTVQKIFSGITRTPRHHTLTALSAAFSDAGPAEFGSHSQQYPYGDSLTSNISDCCPSDISPAQGMVQEPTAVYRTGCSSALQVDTDGSSALQINTDGSSTESRDTRRPDDPVLTNVHYYDRQGNYTLEDYLALPDDQRVELIDGVIYDMSAPYAGHQIISGQLSYFFNSFVDEHGGPCEVFAAATDVQLDCDNKTIVEPDIFIVCNPEKVTLQRIYGAPDLAIEILSKSTRKKDQTLKLWKYCNAGVREYWIVDPAKCRVNVYDFAHDPDLMNAKSYSFHDKIPVGIYEGELVIDFERIWKKIARFYPAETEANLP